MRTAILPGASPKVFANADCLACKEQFTMKEPANWDDYVLWLNGMLLQDAFPYLSVDDRDILLGSRKGAYVCPECSQAAEDEAQSIIQADYQYGDI